MYMLCSGLVIITCNENHKCLYMYSNTNNHIETDGCERTYKL